MGLLNILMRITMLTADQDGGWSLFIALVFHSLINVSFGFFANGGTHSMPWVVSA